jgi:steroid 5-alpha reductase family enzyme
MRKDYFAVVIAYLVAAGAVYLAGKWVAGWHPLLVVAAADLVGTLVIFGFSVLHDNSSVYDAYWSVAPPLIAFYWLVAAAPGGGDDLRRAVVMTLVLLWSARLTLNWAVRWKGLEDEDWRYADLRKKHGRLYWLVSFFGIHLMPTAVVFLCCLAFLPSLGDPTRTVRLLDGIAALVTAGAVWIEWRADLDVTRFRRFGAAPHALLQTGVWSLSRHPNYLGEITFWWGLYLFGISANSKYWWTIIGPLSVTLLFLLVSIPMIEKRLLERKPGYACYQQCTPRLLPRIAMRKKAPE